MQAYIESLIWIGSTRPNYNDWRSWTSTGPFVAGP